MIAMNRKKDNLAGRVRKQPVVENQKVPRSKGLYQSSRTTPLGWNSPKGGQGQRRSQLESQAERGSCMKNRNAKKCLV